MKILHRAIPFGLGVLAALGPSPASAKTVGWWRFEEGTAGECTTADTVFENTANPGSHQAKPYVHVPTSSSSITQATEPAELMPRYTRSVCSIYDPVTGVTYANTNALHIAAEDNETQYYRKGGTVAVADDAAFHLQTMTVEFFVKIKPRESTSDRFIFGQRARGNSYYTWAVRYANRKLYLDIDDSENKRTSTGGIGDNLENGMWHHVAFTLDGTNRKIRLFVDGTASTEASYGGDIVYDNAQSIMFSSCQKQIHTPLDHEVDEVRISDCVLAPEQFLQLIRLPRANSTIGWWRFEEGTLGEYTTADTVFYNEVDPLFHPARPCVHVATTTSGSQATTPAELMPKTVRNAYLVYDPITGVTHANTNALHIASESNETQVSGRGGTVLLGNDAAFELQSMTIEFFVKIPKINATAERPLFGQRANNNKVYTWTVMYVNHGVAMYIDDGNVARKTTSVSRNLEDGMWHRIVAILDGDNHQIQLYVDDTASTPTSYDGDINYNNPLDIMFGPSQKQTYAPIEHELDEVRISEGVLAPEQFLQFVAPPRANSTVGWWRFEEGTQGTATTAETVFYNEVDPFWHPARPYVHVTSDGVRQTNEPSALMPQTVESFDPGFKVYDPVSDTLHENSNALHFVVTDNANKTDGSGNAAPNYDVDGGTVKIPDARELHLQTMTFEFFVKLATLNANFERHLLGQRSDNNKWFTWAIKYVGEKASLEVSDVSTSDAGVRSERRARAGVSANLNDGKWHHVAFTLDHEAHQMLFYVDYVASSPSCLTNVYYENAQAISFGPHEALEFGLMDHWIDEARISDCVLTPDKFLRAVTEKSVAKTSKAATDDTLVLLDFEGDRSEPSSSDFVWSACEAFRNKAEGCRAGMVSVYAQTHAKSGTSNVAPVRFTDDVPGSPVRAGVASTAGETNLAACHTVTNATDNDWASFLILKGPLTYQEMFKDDVTFEVSVKLPPTGNLCSANDALHLFAQWGGLQIITPSPNETGSANRTLTVYVGTNALVRTDGKTWISQRLNDDKWHHLAIVYCKSSAHADFYLDGVWRMDADDIGFRTDSIPGVYQKELCIGGPFYNTWYPLDVKYDDLRITRKALKPYQFLTTRAAADGTLAWATYDQNLLLGPYADLFPEPVVTGTVATDSARPSRVILNGREGDPVRPSNRGSAKFADGAVTYPEQNLVAEQADMTVEFFVRSAAAIAGTGLVRLNRDATNPLGAATWALAFAEDGLSVSVMTNGATVAQAETFIGALDDGQWHHVAVSFVADSDTTIVTYYRDYALVGSRVFNGNLPKGYDANLAVGVGGFSGWIDELRVSPGALTPTSFLWWKPSGLLFFVR